MSRNSNNQTITTALRRVLVSAVVLCFLFSPVLHASAQTQPPNDIVNGVTMLQPNLGLGAGDIRIIIANVIRIGFGLLGIVFVGLVVYGGVMWMTAGGNDEQVGAAKKILKNGILGFIVMLSAYSIVSYIIAKLLGTGPGGDSARAPAQIIQSDFSGSGGLGSVIKDHYPARDQQNVPRNTRIIITFKRPIVASSLITDTNGDGIFGNCKNTTNANFSWDTDCDKLKTGTDYITITRVDTDEDVAGAAVLASGANGTVDTISIRPITPLGSSDAPVQYKVHIGKGILFNDASNGNPSIFAGFSVGHDFYDWHFTCSTVLDQTPPHVVGVFPKDTATEAKNSVIQINFSKPMDPTGLQGEFTQGNSARLIAGDTIFLKNNNSSVPAGSFRLINNYQTLEFTPTTACGTNACGGTIYCLPVCDVGAGSCTQDAYELMVRAATAFNTKSFEAVPFTGAEDASGNALDGNNDGKVQIVARTGEIFGAQGQEQPDNYFWNFNISNQVDLTAPFIRQTTPGPDATFVAADSELSLLFSKTMRVDSMYSIDIDQKPAAAEPIGHRPLASKENTFVKIEHDPFLIDSRHYYYPIVDSEVEDAHFNCFYPAKGPTDTNAASPSKSSFVCNSDGTNCCDVTAANALCCDGLTNVADRSTCLSRLKATSL